MIDDSAVALSLTPGGPRIDLNLDNTTGVSHALLPGFAPSAIDAQKPTEINLGRNHDLVDDFAVVYESSDGSAIAPLVDGTTYFVKRVNNTTLQLSATVGGAVITLDPSVATERDIS